MAKLRFTYNCEFTENGVFSTGETCTDLTMCDNYAALLLIGSPSKAIMDVVEETLVRLEVLKDRVYIHGSIKDIEEVI